MEILRGALHEVQYHAGVYTSILEETRKVISNPNFGLIVVHSLYRIHPPSTIGLVDRFKNNKKGEWPDPGKAEERSIYTPLLNAAAI